MPRTAEQRKADWAKYYAANKEKLKARRALKLVDKEAKAEYNKAYYESNRPKIFARLEERREERLEVQAEYRANNAEKEKARHAKYYTENRDTLRLKQSAYREEYPERKQVTQKKYRTASRGKLTAREGKRRATKLQATPNWANLVQMEGEYTLANKLEKILGTRFQVDHIVPLKSKLVCGLHCEVNLQVIPAQQNLAKGNRYWPNMP